LFFQFGFQVGGRLFTAPQAVSNSGASRSRSGSSGGSPSRQLARSAVLTEAALPIDPTLHLANGSNAGFNARLRLAG